MSAEQNKTLVRSIMEELDHRNLDGVISGCAPDAVFHGFAPQTLDVNGYRGMMSGLLDAFPDSRFPVHDLIAEGDLVACRHTFHGTHQGEFQGIPASDKAVTVPAIALFHIADGAVDEIWLNADFLGLLTQIGAIPAPAQHP